MLADRIIKDDLIESYLAENKFSNAIERLFELQKKEWQDLQNNYSALSDIQSNTFYFDGFRIKTQLNPGRITSTSAKTDKVNILQRNCFLCEHNLPDHQKGIMINESMILLINPFPIFPLHLTIPHTNHIEQEILKHFDLFVDCAKKIGTDFTLMYNGPKCGASAPDHFHFQACKKNLLPVDDDFHQLKNEYGETLLRNDLVEVTTIDDSLRKIISIETNDSRILLHTFSLIILHLQKFLFTDEEPKVNLLCSYEEDHGWRVIIFLRSKHRPEIYFSEKDDKLLFSPAVVDVAGLCITPLEKDFIRLDKNLITKIFNEVFISPNEFYQFTSELAELLSYDSFND
ncbi:MAG: DUF4922 domain-containing protein [Ignavibacteriales bacterium]|nr:MAG: DUF4922 domain-containing protein [Ignavibacteriales bacterium]